MNQAFRRTAKRTINSLFEALNLELVRRDRGFKDYIPFGETLRGAKEAGLPVGDYIDAKHNVPGSTKRTIDEMKKCGVFGTRIERVCEIGPGSGRYLAETLRACNPDNYEVYETAQDWKKWLMREYGIIAHAADGLSLSQTTSCSIDLVQAHKVFPGLPVITIGRYFAEMARVVRENGKVVFDILTEECLDDATLEKWFASDAQYACSMIAKQFAIDFFVKRGLSFVGSFFIDMRPGVTQYLVFKKQGTLQD